MSPNCHQLWPNDRVLFLALERKRVQEDVCVRVQCETLQMPSQPLSSVSPAQPEPALLCCNNLDKASAL